MFYSKQVINELGYESIDDFVEYFINQYKNCCIRFFPDGVYLNYDFDSN
jgi:hypothetical protein